MGFHDLFGDGEPQPFSLSAVLVGYTKELVEDPIQEGAGIPLPVSETLKQTSCPAASARMRMAPPGEVYLMALDRRFTSTCSMRAVSASTGGRSTGTSSSRVSP